MKCDNENDLNKLYDIFNKLQNEYSERMKGEDKESCEYHYLFGKMSSYCVSKDVVKGLQDGVI